MFGYPLVSGHCARGTLCAAIGLLVIAAYYVHAWRNLRNGPVLAVTPDAPVSPGRQHWPELRHLQWGVLSSVLLFMLAGAADTENDWLFRLVGGLMGFVAALFFGMFGVGFVALWNLWKELALQLKKAKIGSLFLSIPLALLWLGLGVGVFILFGMLLEKLPKSWELSLPALLLGLVGVIILKPILEHLIAHTFHGLWESKSHGALMLRLILMVCFSAIIVAAVLFSFWWISSQTAPLLVICLSSLGSLNVIFYSRWVRPTALEDNLEDPPFVESNPKHLN